MKIVQQIQKAIAAFKQWRIGPVELDGLDRSRPYVKVGFEPVEGARSNYELCYVRTPSNQLWQSVNGQWNHVKAL